MAEKTYVKTGLMIARITRLNSSRNGNPRFQVSFTDGTVAPTGVDCAIAYGIQNSEYRGVPLSVTFNSRGHILYVNIVKAGK